MLYGIRGYSVYRCKSYTSFWNIDYSLYRYVIKTIFYRAEIGEHIFYFFTLVEVYSTDYPVRNIVCYKFFLENT